VPTTNAFGRSLRCFYSTIHAVEGDLLQPLKVSDPERIVEEFGDYEAERRAAHRGAEGLCRLVEAMIQPGVVSVGEDSTGEVAGDQGVVRSCAAIVRFRDQSTRGGVENAFDDVMAVAHLVIARIVTKDRGEDGIAEDVFADVPYSSSAKTHAKCTAVGAVVWTSISQLAVSGGRDPSGHGEEGEGFFEPESDLPGDREGWGDLSGLNGDVATGREQQTMLRRFGGRCIGI
jgi:hypothetical protein